MTYSPCQFVYSPATHPPGTSIFRLRPEALFSLARAHCMQKTGPSRPLCRMFFWDLITDWQLSFFTVFKIMPVTAFFACIFSSALFFGQDLFVVIHVLVPTHGYLRFPSSRAARSNPSQGRKKVSSVGVISFGLCVFLVPSLAPLGPLQAGSAPRGDFTTGDRHLLGSPSTYPVVPSDVLWPVTGQVSTRSAATLPLFSCTLQLWLRSCTCCLHKDAWCTKTSRPHAWSRKDVFFSRNCQNCQGAHRASLTGTRSWRRAASQRRSLPPFLRSTKIAVVQESLPSMRRPSEDLCAQGSQNKFVSSQV